MEDAIPSRQRKQEITKNTYICSKHFKASDFAETSQDTNKSRKNKKAEANLNHRYLKEDIVPSIFPNCPTYLTNSVAARSTAMASAFVREAKTNQMKQVMLKKQLELDLVKQLSDIETNFRNKFRFEPSLEKTQLIKKDKKSLFS